MPKAIEMYPYLQEWLDALRNSESGLATVLLVTLTSVLLLVCYRQIAPNEFAKMRATMFYAFVIISLVLVFVVG